MDPAFLDRVLAVVNREDGYNLDALERVVGKTAQGSHDTTVRVVNGRQIAVIPVVGPIVRHADLLTAVCGGTTLRTMQDDVAKALDDPETHGVMLSVDSPGGEVTGLAEFAAYIRTQIEGETA